MSLARLLLLGAAGYLLYTAYRRWQEGGALLPALPAPPPPRPLPAPSGESTGGNFDMSQQAPFRDPAQSGPAIGSTQASPLIAFCTAIRDFEGKPGDRNYRNNNPGNARFYSGHYAAAYGQVRPDGAGYAVFPSWGQGWQYLLNLVRHKAAANPGWDFDDFFQSYAPAADHNSPDTYAAFVAQRCGVPVTAKVLAFLNSGAVA